MTGHWPKRPPDNPGGDPRPYIEISDCTIEGTVRIEVDEEARPLIVGVDRKLEDDRRGMIEPLAVNWHPADRSRTIVIGPHVAIWMPPDGDDRGVSLVLGEFRDLSKWFTANPFIRFSGNLLLREIAAEVTKAADYIDAMAVKEAQVQSG